MTAGANTVEFTFDAAGQLSLTERPAGNEKLLYFYDGRNYLAEAKEPPVPPCPSGTNPIFSDAFETNNTACWSSVTGGSSGGSCPWQEGGDRLAATYSSEGVLFGLSRFPQGQPEEKLAILRFGDRPVAIWKKVGSNPATLTYVTADHLGTPVLAMNSTGSVVWSGGFEPFGREFTVPSAEASGVFLRLPGQWEDPFFDPSTLGVNLHYNLHRWYEPSTGRYIATDPMGLWSGEPLYVYALGNPIAFSDPLGLATFACQRPLKQENPKPGNRKLGPDVEKNPLFHSYLCVKNADGTVECHGQTYTDSMRGSPGRPTTAEEGDIFIPENCDPVHDDPCFDECVRRTGRLPNRPWYTLAGEGENCQEWTAHTITDCRKNCNIPEPTRKPDS
jgi:RHS repeat-associated protein